MRHLPARIAAAAISLALSPLAGAVYVDHVDVYQVGDTRDDDVTLTWNHAYDFSGVAGTDAILVIEVEGVDIGELDEVSFNDEVLGNLAQSTLYSETYEIGAGPGYLPDKTEITPSMFFIPVSSLKAVNVVKVKIDGSGGGWIAEVETSELMVETPEAPVPEPATWAQMGLGAIALGWFLRRRRA